MKKLLIIILLTVLCLQQFSCSIFADEETPVEEETKEVSQEDLPQEETSEEETAEVIQEEEASEESSAEESFVEEETSENEGSGEEGSLETDTIEETPEIGIDQELEPVTQESADESEISLDLQETDETLSFPDIDDYDDFISGKRKLTYSLFGAAGDGVTNDYLAIRMTHEYANKLYAIRGSVITVYGEAGKRETGSVRSQFTP